jgi:hypothetical protein
MFLSFDFSFFSFLLTTHLEEYVEAACMAAVQGRIRALGLDMGTLT